MREKFILFCNSKADIEPVDGLDILAVVTSRDIKRDDLNILKARACELKKPYIVDNIIKNTMDEIRKIVLENKEISFIVDATLTDIAIFLLSNPDCKKYIKKLYFIGGSYFTGNRTMTSDRNVYDDVLAASIVFKSGLDIVVLPMELEEDKNKDRRDILLDYVNNKILLFEKPAMVVIDDKGEYSYGTMVIDIRADKTNATVLYGNEMGGCRDD